jgi:hypothetical protein
VRFLGNIGCFWLDVEDCQVVRSRGSGRRSDLPCESLRPLSICGGSLGAGRLWLRIAQA